MLALLRLLRQFQALGPLANIYDEDALRAWLRGLAEIGVDAAGDTADPADDQLVAALSEIVSLDDKWQQAYRLLLDNA